jgi:hypothetical protein
MDNYLPKKAFEISYALFRIAESMKHRGFAGYLEDAGIALLKSAAAGDAALVRQSASVIECLVRFGADVDVIGQKNSQLIIREIRNISSAIAEPVYPAKAADVDIGDIFKIPFGKHDQAEGVKKVADRRPRETDSRGENIQDADQRAPDRAVRSEEGETPPLEGSALPQTTGRGDQSNSSENRQKLILEKIRQSGNPPAGRAGCRLKDIQELLPDTSERTLRYDLQELVERRLVERIGSSGPSTYYQVPPAG